MTRDDGTESYWVVDRRGGIRAASYRPFLRDHVIPHLPVTFTAAPYSFEWDTAHPDYPCVQSLHRISAEVRHFILGTGEPPVLWGWCSAFDHVLLSQLFGDFAAAPPGFPRHTNDLQQEADRLGITDLPPMPGARAHHALDDAREIRYRMHWLKAHQDGWRNCPCPVCAGLHYNTLTAS